MDGAVEVEDGGGSEGAAKDLSSKYRYEAWGCLEGGASAVYSAAKRGSGWETSV